MDDDDMIEELGVTAKSSLARSEPLLVRLGVVLERRL
jgi:hypothetical protein